MKDYGKGWSQERIIKSRKGVLKVEHRTLWKIMYVTLKMGEFERTPPSSEGS